MELFVVLLGSIVGIVSLVGFFIAVAFLLGVLYGKIYWKPLHSIPAVRNWLGWNLYKRWVNFKICDTKGVEYKSILDYEDKLQQELYYKYHHSSSSSSSRKFVYACYPHGLFAVAPFLAFCTKSQHEFAGARDRYPTILVHDLLLQVPIVREIAFALGCSSIGKTNFAEKLTSPESETYTLALVPGGVREMILDSNGNHAGNPPDHFGFLRLIHASKKSVVIVPCWTPNENKLFKTWNVLTSLRVWLAKVLRYPFPTLFFGPLPVDLTMYVGEPIYGDSYGTFEQLRTAFLNGLKSLKQNAGAPAH